MPGGAEPGAAPEPIPNNLWAEIIGNCDIQLMLGCTDDVTAEFFSARSGDMSIQVNSTMTVRQTMAVAQVIPQYRQTQGQGKRRLLTPRRGAASAQRGAAGGDPRAQSVEAPESGLYRASHGKRDCSGQCVGLYPCPAAGNRTAQNSAPSAI